MTGRGIKSPGQVSVNTRSITGRVHFLHTLSPSGWLLSVAYRLILGRILVESLFYILSLPVAVCDRSRMEASRSITGRKSFLHSLSPSGCVFSVVWTPMTGRDPIESRSSACLCNTGQPVDGLLTGQPGMLARSQTGRSPDAGTGFFI